MKKLTTVDAYIDQFDAEQQELLRQIRSIVLHHIPQGTEELISYAMPTYKYQGKNVLHFALFKTHLGLYAGADAIEAFAQQLHPYKTNKGTIQLPLDKPLPQELIANILAFNVQETVRNTKEKHTDYREQWSACEEIMQRIIVQTTLKKERKWGIDVYTYAGKNVVAWIGFKHFFSVWFYNGVFLTDPFRVLINASEGKTKSLRQWRFASVAEMDEMKIKAYIEEAIQAARDGKELKPEKPTELVLEEVLQQALVNDTSLYQAFEALTKGKQREYNTYIMEAKQEKTKHARLQKIIPLIQQGKGLHDKYRK